MLPVARSHLEDEHVVALRPQPPERRGEGLVEHGGYDDDGGAGRERARATRQLVGEPRRRETRDHGQRLEYAVELLGSTAGSDPDRPVGVREGAVGDEAQRRALVEGGDRRRCRDRDAALKQLDVGPEGVLGERGDVERDHDGPCTRGLVDAGDEPRGARRRLPVHPLHRITGEVVT